MIVIIFLIYALSVVTSEHHDNNVCPTHLDYDTKLVNNKCWYNSDVDLSVMEIIIKYGYPFEEYEIITEDGYILPLYRIPHGRYSAKSQTIVSQPVFLQHGFVCTSAPWVTNGNNSIAFILADEGYDVWLGNSRGTTYGYKHVNLSTEDIRYWNFSFHEMAIYDIPKSLDYIYSETGRNDIIFIGQSMGTNIQLAYASLLPEHAKQRVKFMVYLGPTAYLLGVKTLPLVVGASFWPTLNIISKALGIEGVLTKSQFPTTLNTLLCTSSKIQSSVCDFLLMSIFGFDPENITPDIFPIILAHYPGGSSVKTIIHLSQNIVSRRFCRFDYGHERNKEVYNSPQPPDYDLSKVLIPGLIMYGSNDFLATRVGATATLNGLPKGSTSLYEIKYRKFTHFNFFYGKSVVPYLINPMLSYMNMYKTTKERGSIGKCSRKKNCMRLF